MIDSIYLALCKLSEVNFVRHAQFTRTIEILIWMQTDLGLYILRVV